MSKKEKRQRIILICAMLVLIFVAIFSGLQILEATVLPGIVSPSETNPSKTITRDGVEYFPRQDITVVMVLGIDQHGPVQDSGYHKNPGAADMVMLLVFDETAKEYSVLQLNRDTMLEMTVLGIRGENAGTYYGQLALAHTYGSGLADSSVNVKNTLMKHIHGLTVDYYVTMNMDAIPIVNDAVGGVTVTVVDDFSEVNPSITKGEITLRGDQVLDFVQTRKNVGDQKNTTRMERQQEYMTSFLKTLKEKAKEDAELAVKLYDQVSPYMVTDCSAETLSSMLNRYMDYTMAEIISPEGESRVVEGYYEFYVDEDKFEDLIIEVFYKEKG